MLAPAEATANAIALPAPPAPTRSTDLFGRMVAFPLHPKNAADAIRYRADPASIRFAADDVERADLTSGRIQLVDKCEHPLLMRHSDQHAGQIAHRSCTADEGRQVICLDPERNASRVGYAVRQTAGSTIVATSPRSAGRLPTHRVAFCPDMWFHCGLMSNVKRRSIRAHSKRRTAPKCTLHATSNLRCAHAVITPSRRPAAA